MKAIIFFWILTVPFFVVGKTDTTIFFGVNGKVESFKKADIRKTIKSRSGKSIKIFTDRANEEEWKLLFYEKIKLIDDSTYKIKVRGDEFSGKIIRRYVQQADGTYKFTDWLDERIKRIGHSRSKFPLLFEGEVTEFYSSGRIKSISQYKNNELLSNRNWMPSGDPVVDNIFYSVDRKPLFVDGIGQLHQHILKTFKDYKVDLSILQGTILVGFVVRTDGVLDGIRIVKGITPQVNAVALKAFQTSSGPWSPAYLNDQPVNYFQIFPINFLNNNYNFDSLEFDGEMLFWEIN